MNTLNEVKKLHDMGFAILWLYPKSKRPIGEDWTSGERKDWATLKKNFKEANNVGVRLGEASKFPDDTYLCVLDCDVKSSDPAHLKEMELALHNFCPSHEFAPRVLSGRGGGSCHFYFRTKKPQQAFKAIRSNHKIKVHMPSVDASKTDREGLAEDEIKAGYRLRLAWEVDVFGEGKQVVLPPSTHPDTGRAYQWESPLRDYESIPLHKNFEPNVVRLVRKNKRDVSFARDFDLFSTPVSEKFFNLITSGKGFENYASRSEALFAALNGLILAGLTDDQIYSVLTDSSNFMSEKPLQNGKGDPVQAARWLQGQIDKIRDEKSAELAFKDEVIIDDLEEMLALSDEEAAAQEEELVSWQSRLQGTKTGQWKNTAMNLYLILKNLSGELDREQCVFAYDEFNQSIVYTFAPPWGDEGDVGRELSDLDDIRVKTWLSREWGIEASTQSVADITYQLAKENAFHPVQRYLKSLKWDGKQRLNSMFAKYCGARGDTRYLSDVGRKMMCAAVARVFHAGIKFDHVVILEGNQGIGKSSFISILANQWYSDSLGDITNKDVVDNMRGKWLIELGELAAMSRAEVNDLKAFVTRQNDVARKAYGRRAQTYPRQCIFIGSTNDEEYLKDATGGRRFLPVAVTKFNFKAIERDRDQLWAEAYVTYQLGEALYLDDEHVREIAAGEQKDRFVVDEIQTTVKAIVDSEDFPNEFDFNDIWSRMALMEGKALQKSCDFPTQLRIKKALRVLGYPKVRKRVGDSSTRTYMWVKSNDDLTYKSY